MAPVTGSSVKRSRYPVAMFRSRIDLIGGGPGTLGSLRKHLKASLSAVATKQKPLVAYVGAASGDDTEFEAMVGAEIERAGGRTKGVKLASPRAKVSAATALLDDCDVVFVSGGDVDAGMRVLSERGVLPVFEALAREGRPMIGISAGSIMLGRAWVRFAEGPSKRLEVAERFPCMGLAPVYVDAHAEEDRWGELKVLLGLCRDAGERDVVGHGLTRQGGVRVVPAGEGVRLEAFGTAAPRWIVRNGRVVAGRPLALGRDTPAATPRRRPRAR